MQSSLEQLEGIKRKLTVEIPAERVDEEVNNRLREIRPRVRLDGFRPGKVPANVVKQRYGASIRQEALEKLIDSSLRDAFEEHDCAPVASPQIELESGLNSGEAIKYTANFEVMPEVEVKGLEELSITLPESELQESDIDDMITTLRQQQATYSEKEDGSVESDRVTVDFTGKIDGETFEGGSGESITFSIGGGQMLPDFEAGVKGSKAGETRQFDVTFPEDYANKELAGKTAQFDVNVKKVEAMHLPEVDAEFISKFGMDATDEASFRNAVRENMQRELGNALRRIKRECMLAAIHEKNSDQLVAEGQIAQAAYDIARENRLDQQIKDEEKLRQLALQYFADAAERRIRLGLLLGKLFENREITLDKERFNQRLDNIVATYEDAEEVRRYYLTNEQLRKQLESSVLEEQLIDELYAKADVSHETKTFKEVMAQNAQLQY